MQELPRQQLREIIASHGSCLCDEPRRCEALLREACPGYAPAVELLMVALNNKVPAELNAAPAGTSWEAMSRPLRRRLEDDVTEEAARWAVESWGLALGKVTDAQLPPPPAVLTEEEFPEPEAGPRSRSRLVPLLMYQLTLSGCWALLGLNGWAWGGLIARLASGGTDWHLGGAIGLALTGFLVLLLVRRLWGVRVVTALGWASGAVIGGAAGLGLVSAAGLGLGFSVGGFTGALAALVIGNRQRFAGALPVALIGALGGGLAGALGAALTGMAGWALAGAVGLALVEAVGTTLSAVASREERGRGWVVRCGVLGALAGAVSGAGAGAGASLLAQVLADQARAVNGFPQPLMDLAGQDKVLALVLLLALVEMVLLAVGLIGLALLGRTRPKARGGKLFEGHFAPVHCVAVSPDGQRAVSGGEDEVLRLWDLASGEELQRFQGHTGDVTGVAFARDGLRFLSGGLDGTLRLWDVESGAELSHLRLRLPTSIGNRMAVALSGDGRLALAGTDGLGGWGRKSWLVYLWDVESGELLHRLKGHGSFIRHGFIFSVALAPDGRSALSGSNDHTLRLWDVGSGEERHCFRGHTRAVTAVAFSPDGRRLLSGGVDQTVRLWDVASGEEVCCFQGHRAGVLCVAYAPDGRRVLSGGCDGTIRLWDVETGIELHCFEGQESASGLGEVRGVAFCPDGRSFLSASADHSVRLWEIPR